MSESMIRLWSEIVSHYTWLIELGLPYQSMLSLVEKIQSSSCSEGLLGWTSMHDLCIVQTPVKWPKTGPYLRISPLRDDKIEFRYLDTIFEDKQWSRVVAGAEAFARLEGFLRQLHWFSEDWTFEKT